MQNEKEECKKNLKNNSFCILNYILIFDFLFSL